MTLIALWVPPAKMDNPDYRKVRSASVKGFSQYIQEIESGARKNPLVLAREDQSVTKIQSAIGSADVVLDEAAKVALKRVPLTKGTIFDVGAGYGLWTREAIETSNEPVMAIEMSREQLAYIADYVAQGKQQFSDRLALVHGFFPDHFPNKLFDLPFFAGQEQFKRNLKLHNGAGFIYASRIFHLMSPQELQQTATRMRALGNSSLVVVATASTPYAEPFKKFIPIFEERIRQGDLERAGVIDFKNYLHGKAAEGYGKLEEFNLLVPETISWPFRQLGFQTRAFYYPELDIRTELVSEEFRGVERVVLFAWLPQPDAPENAQEPFLFPEQWNDLLNPPLSELQPNPNFGAKN